MLGREFAVTSHQLFVVWDYIFACCFDAEQTSAAEDEDIPTNVYSMLANARLLGNRKDMNSALQRKSSERPSYVCTPLLGALGDFMLAMLLHVRHICHGNHLRKNTFRYFIDCLDPRGVDR